MPTLPSVDQMQRPTPSPSLPVARVRNAGVIGQAETNLGHQILNVGDALGKIEEQLVKSRRTADLANALGQATNEINNLEVQYSHDPDFKTSTQRFQKDAEQIQSKYENQIEDATVKVAFSQEFRKLAQSKQLNVLKEAVAKEGDYNVANLDQNLLIYANAYAMAKNPAEKSAIGNQVQLSIASMVAGGWLKQSEAVKREQNFRSQVDQQMVLNDMGTDPASTSEKLALDPTYATSLNPVQRQRLVDMGYRQAETQRARKEREEEKARKLQGEENMKEAWSRQANGTLDRQFIDSIKPTVSDTDYHALLTSLKGEPEQDDPGIYSSIVSEMDKDPEIAMDMAYRAQSVHQIKSTTLRTFVNEARTRLRQEGPRSEYERTKEYITEVLKPPQQSFDPAAQARHARAIRDFNDFVMSDKHTDEELRKKGDEIVKHYSIIDMNNLVDRTALGNRNNPPSVKEAVDQKARKLNEQHDRGELTDEQWKDALRELIKTRRAAEAADATGKR